MEVTCIWNSAGENQDLAALPCHPQLWMLRLSVGKVMVLRVRPEAGISMEGTQAQDGEMGGNQSLRALTGISKTGKQVSELCTLGFGFLSSIIGC